MFNLYSLHSQHWAGIIPYTIMFIFAKYCVLSKQLFNSILCHQLFTLVFLIPKLRNHFAEFLSNSSLIIHLSILYLLICVDFRIVLNYDIFFLNHIYRLVFHIIFMIVNITCFSYHPFVFEVDLKAKHFLISYSFRCEFYP